MTGPSSLLLAAATSAAVSSLAAASPGPGRNVTIQTKLSKRDQACPQSTGFNFEAMDGDLGDDFLVAKAGPAVETGKDACSCATLCNGSPACDFFVWTPTPSACFIKPLVTNPSFVTVFVNAPGQTRPGVLADTANSPLAVGVVPTPNIATLQGCIDMCRAMPRDQCSIISFDSTNNACYPKKTPSRVAGKLVGYRSSQVGATTSTQRPPVPATTTSPVPTTGTGSNAGTGSNGGAGSTAGSGTDEKGKANNSGSKSGGSDDLLNAGGGSSSKVPLIGGIAGAAVIAIIAAIVLYFYRKQTKTSAAGQTVAAYSNGSAPSSPAGADTAGGSTQAMASISAGSGASAAPGAAANTTGATTSAGAGVAAATAGAAAVAATRPSTSKGASQPPRLSDVAAYNHHLSYLPGQTVLPHADPHYHDELAIQHDHAAASSAAAAAYGLPYHRQSQPYPAPASPYTPGVPSGYAYDPYAYAAGAPQSPHGYAYHPAPADSSSGFYPSYPPGPAGQHESYYANSPSAHYGYIPNHPAHHQPTDGSSSFPHDDDGIPAYETLSADQLNAPTVHRPNQSPGATAGGPASSTLEPQYSRDSKTLYRNDN
ncbi:uncharacterized protein EV422DRAFT_514728 [Fimicolochytrium jonesii]|uniref:uncharacterized protein n=1 Tax=Fimicolochytrium jonesii TaxID=1396493 RepID=UPI0022FF2ABA|nr:uncharacterized protein EV422DRAFT_514728 [Fimicolochytrium jonesii]KAI8825939.1 hypothetical protein EV422DRAFT_514728 [Fimicolochytrium jonesii]